MMRVALAALVFLCAAWAATMVPDKPGPFAYMGGIYCDYRPLTICPDIGRYAAGWWPADFLKMVGILDTDLRIAGPPDDPPQLMVLYDGTTRATVYSLPVEIDILGIDYDGDDVTLSIDLEGPPNSTPYPALPADLISIGPGDTAKIASAISSATDLAIDQFPWARAQTPVWFVSAHDLANLAASASITVGPGLEPGMYHFWAEVSDGQGDRRQAYFVDYDPGGEDKYQQDVNVPEPVPDLRHVTVLVAAAAAALLVLPLLPAGSRVAMLPGPACGYRYMRYCTAIGAAWLAASAALSVASGLASALDNIMMLPASLVMMGSPVAYYVVSRPPMGARRGPARTAASVALMALGLWSAFYVLYGIPSALLAISFVALLPAAGCCLGAALFWAGFRRACRWPGQALDSRDGFDTQGQSGLLEQGK